MVLLAKCSTHAGDGLRVIQSDHGGQQALLLCLTDAEQLVSLNLAQRLAQLQERSMPSHVFLFDGLPDRQDALLAHHVSKCAAQPRVPPDSVGENARCAGERLGLGVDALVRIYERLAEPGKLRRQLDLHRQDSFRGRNRLRSLPAGLSAGLLARFLRSLSLRSFGGLLVSGSGSLGTCFARSLRRQSSFSGSCFALSRFRRCCFAAFGDFCSCHRFGRRFRRRFDFDFDYRCGSLGFRAFATGRLFFALHFISRRKLAGSFIDRLLALDDCNDLVGQLRETAIHSELDLGLRPPVRNEQVLNLAAVHTPPDLVDNRGRDALRTFEHAKNCSASAVELIEGCAPTLHAANHALGQTARIRAADTTDVRCTQASVDQFEHGADVLGLQRELVR